MFSPHDPVIYPTKRNATMRFFPFSSSLIAQIRNVLTILCMCNHISYKCFRKKESSESIIYELVRFFFRYIYQMNKEMCYQHHLHLLFISINQGRQAMTTQQLPPFSLEFSFFLLFFLLYLFHLLHVPNDVTSKGSRCLR